jgi:hypothetical protein
LQGEGFLGWHKNSILSKAQKTYPPVPTSRDAKTASVFSVSSVAKILFILSKNCAFSPFFQKPPLKKIVDFPHRELTKI